MDSVMHLAFATDENYVQHLGVMLASIEAHHPNQDICVHIATLKKGANACLLDQWALDYDKIHLDWIVLSEDFIGDVRFGAYHVSKASYLRLLIPAILRKSVKRLLYLDCDMVCLQPLGDLLEIELDDNIIAAVPEPIFYPNKIGVDIDSGMFNSGLMLVDVDSFCANGVDEKALEFARTKKHLMRYHDQDALNYSLLGKWKKLHSRWNLQHFSRSIDADSVQIGSKEVLESFIDPAIIHFVGPHKPWLPFCNNPYARCYDEYLKKTPWCKAGKDWAAYRRWLVKAVKRRLKLLDA